MADLRQFSELGPELDFLALRLTLGEEGNLRDRVSRLLRAGTLVGVVRGIYVTAPELRKRPVSLEILANMINGPSYVSFEYALSRAGLIPEAAVAITSASATRNRRYVTPLGAFLYRRLPPAVYRFGWTRQELADGSGYLVARPEKALLDWLFVAGAARSVRALEERLESDLRLDRAAFESLDRERLAEYVALMPGRTFAIHFRKLLERRRGGAIHA